MSILENDKLIYEKKNENISTYWDLQFKTSAIENLKFTVQKKKKKE